MVSHITHLPYLHIDRVSFAIGACTLILATYKLSIPHIFFKMSDYNKDTLDIFYKFLDFSEVLPDQIF